MKFTRRIASLLLAIFIFTGITAQAANATGRYLKNGIAFHTTSSITEGAHCVPFLFGLL